MIYLFSHDEDIKLFYQKNIFNDTVVKFIGLDFFVTINDISNEDIFILDIDEFESIEKIIEYSLVFSHKLNIIAITKEPYLSQGALLIKKGFKSYLGKDTDEKLVKIAISSVENGNVWLYPQLMNFIIKHISIEKENYASLNKLSEKEQEVALLVAKGFSNNEIANQLDVQIITIKKHISHIFSKLKVKDRLSLALQINK